MAADTEYIRVANGYLEIRQKLGEGRPSQSGKTTLLVSTGGFRAIANTDVRVNLTATKPVA